MLARLDAMDERLGRMEALLARIAGASIAQPPVRSEGEDALRARVLTIVSQLDMRSGHGGLVPISEVRAELRRAGSPPDDRAVDAALLTLERERLVELRVAQSPASVADRASGIERPGRGLVYWVSPRSS